MRPKNLTIFALYIPRWIGLTLRTIICQLGELGGTGLTTDSDWLATYTLKICPGLHLLALGQAGHHQDDHRHHHHHPHHQLSGPPTHLCFHLKGNLLDKGVNIRGLTSLILQGTSGKQSVVMTSRVKSE